MTIEQDLSSVLKLVDSMRQAEDFIQHVRAEEVWRELKSISAHFAMSHGPALLRALADQRRYRFLSDSAACSLSISHNDHHNMYLSVEDTLDDSQGYYDEVQPEEKAKMISDDSIWTVHIYPNTPVGFNVYHAATLDAAVEAAMVDYCVPLDQEGE